MSEVLVELENIHKKFCSKLKTSMIYGVRDVIKKFLHHKSKHEFLRENEFWALENIHFKLKRGQALGVIGRNGSGKTTLLRLIAGIFPPDQGKITIKGRVSALIALGAGFHPHLSGRENIFLNGSILGMSQQEIKQKLDAIIDFSELGSSINAPVAAYSSGMKVKLGFSIAIHTQPDILLIDEVLSVGDAAFRIKCYNAIARMAPRCAIIFVSHSMPHVLRLVDYLLVLNKGKIHYLGENIQAGIENYYELLAFPFKNIVYDFNRIRLIDFSFPGFNKTEVIFGYGQKIKIDFKLITEENFNAIHINIVFRDKFMQDIASCLSEKIDLKADKPAKINMALNENLFTTGVYTVNMAIFSTAVTDRQTLARFDNVGQLKIQSTPWPGQTPIRYKSEWNVE